MDTFVLVLQDRDGTRRFYAPSQAEPWTRNLLAAGEYVHRYDAEADARATGAIVMTRFDAWTVADDAGLVPA